MNERIYSASWYRVAELRPRLRSHARVHRHVDRGEVSFVLEDSTSGRFYRCPPGLYSVLTAMDGRHTVQEIWERTCEDQEACTQDQVIRLLSQLHVANVLQCDSFPHTANVLKRHDQQRQRLKAQRLMNPLFWRVPVVDPERFLNRFVPYVRVLFTRIGFLVWLSVVCVGLVLACLCWRDLTEDVMDRVLAPQNLVLLWLLVPFLKALHELGHAFAVKAYGGEVHDMGIFLVAFTPFPYVDASAASAFRSRRQRIVVGAAGMMVEVFVASLALAAWLMVEPGIVRALLFNVIILAGVSTLLVNANPLVRFDGYYILSDAIGIPSLSSRARRYLAHVFEKHVLGCTESTFPRSTRSERAWFVGYSISSFVYRTVVVVAIILFVAGKFFFIGVLLAFWALTGWVVVPLASGLRYLLTSRRLRTVRARAVLVTTGIAGALALFIWVVPVPRRTVAEGIVRIPDEAVVRAGTDGFVVRLLATPGHQVHVGDPLFLCEDPTLLTRHKTMEAGLAELRARRGRAWLEDRVEAQILDEEIAHRKEALGRETDRLEELTIRSPTDGVFVVLQATDLPGRFARKGDPLAYVMNTRTLCARVVVSGDDVDLIRNRTHQVELRLAERPEQSLASAVRREVPRASKHLPSAALGSGGGGKIATDPVDGKGTRSLQKFFQFDLDLPALDDVVRVGGRVYARFDHGSEPLAVRWYDSFRRLFLARYNV